VVAVADDVATGRISPDEALAAYGVALDDRGVPDAAATQRRRERVRRERLELAKPPVRVLTGEQVAAIASPGADADSLPLFPGVVQRGALAFTEGGAPLAIAPAHWTDGCPVLEEELRGGGPRVVLRSYLDPASGRALHVEAVPAGEPRSFECAPRRWTESTVAGDRAPAYVSSPNAS
jgi:N-methylhydantoinase B